MESPFSGEGIPCDCDLCKRHRIARKIQEKLDNDEKKFIEDTFTYLMEVETDLAWIALKGVISHPYYSEGGGI